MRLRGEFDTRQAREVARLEGARNSKTPWRKWRHYLSERQEGRISLEYSADLPGFGSNCAQQQPDLKPGYQLDPRDALAAREVPVGVAYGRDPEQLINLLVEVGGSNSGVMRDPKPSAFFVGFGDSALNFELRFWSARQESWFQLKSDVTTSVAKALGEAGIEIPFPQRDLRVRSIDASIKSTDSLKYPSAQNP